MKKILLLLGLIAAILLAYYCVRGDSIKIQKDIQSRLAQSFQSENISGDVNRVVSGRDVTLTGVVPAEELRLEAGRVANALHGVRMVDNQIKVVVPPPPPAPEPEPMPIPEPIVQQPVMDPTIIVSEPVIEEPIVVLEQPVIEQPVTVYEEPVVVANDVDLDQPLTVKSGRIVTRDVDSVIAQKTVEVECENGLTSLLSDNKIHFDTGRATIKAKSHKLLDRMVVAAKDCDESTIITINGYTDNVGDTEANRQLSLRRARAVGQYMLRRGVAKRVKVVGHGENDPIADNDTEEGRAQNRRIEFKVYGN